MKRSSERILTTHVGSLVRPPEILEAILTTASGRERDEAAFEALVRDGVRDVVAKQAEVGVDIPSDGEYSKPNFHGYVIERLEGLTTELEPETPRGTAMNYPILNQEFPGFMAQYNAMYRTMWMPPSVPRELVDAAIKRTSRERTAVCGRIRYKGQAQVECDLENFRDALAGHSFEEAFVPSATPARNDADPGGVYQNEQQYLYDLADAMHEEYKAIVDAGFILQIDDPALVDIYDWWFSMHDDIAGYRKWAASQVEAVNHALEGIPEDRVRFHICWGSWHGPHKGDVPLKDIVDLLLKVKAQAYSVEAGNVRHEHEWKVFRDVKLPEGKIVIPGVVSHATNVLEHPEVIADRLIDYASVVGRENVIASTDCGLGGRIHPQLAWAKLQALREGADLASKQLWR
jgi:5-methyltetrahydropteroyltriglutamate--homocysteine methyltransferase